MEGRPSMFDSTNERMTGGMIDIILGAVRNCKATEISRPSSKFKQIHPSGL